MTGRWKYRSFEDAVQAVIAHSRTVTASEHVPIDCSFGRVVAETVRGKRDIPPWDRSTVDGYALRSLDTERRRTVTMNVVGHVSAGQFFRGSIGRDECTGIATGAPLPQGSDASVMFEHVEEHDGGSRISLSFGVKSGENVSRRGADISRGDVIAEKGRTVNTGMIGALASQGMQRIKVLKKPVIAVIPGGDEVVPLGRNAGKGQIFDVNSHTIASVVEREGGHAVIAARVKDERHDVRKALVSAVKYDACVFASGSSAGQRDFVAGVIEQEGRLLFHGVRVRPGRPTMFGVVGKKPVFGLAGHPVSSFLGAYYFLGPAVRRMAGIPPAAPRTVQASFSGESGAESEVLRLLPVYVGDGECRSVFKESGAITSVSRANGIVRQPPGMHIRHGDTVNVELIEV